MKHEEQNFLSVIEAADFLKVRTATLYAWVHQRRIPFRKHGARLAFSATPPDFGALLIQRRRWANGGLLILPKLLRYVAGRASHASGVSEALVRCHYLVSIAAVNVTIGSMVLAGAASPRAPRPPPPPPPRPPRPPRAGVACAFLAMASNNACRRP